MAPDSPLPPGKNHASHKKGGSVVARYRTTLATLSVRTGTALPALVTSFAILHEATAVAPLIGVFYACRTFGIGEQVVGYARKASSSKRGEDTTWVASVGERWMAEGEQWAGKVGRRYGMWGFQKGGDRLDEGSSTSTRTGAGVAGDVANALVAYCAAKALLPVRIGLSLYYAPAFARQVITPVSRSVRSVFERSK